MALTQCPECGKEISDQSSSCINCGYPLNENTKNVPTIKFKQRRNIKLLLLVVLSFVCVAIVFVPVFFSGNKTNNGNTNSLIITTTEQSAYEQLGRKEQLFLDAFLPELNQTFYNPESVIVKYVWGFDTDDADSIVDAWDVTVSAHNQYGGYSEQEFTLYTDKGITVPILPHNDMGCNYNLELINKAIEEYFE